MINTNVFSLILLTNIELFFLKSNKKCRKVMNLLKIKCIMPFFWRFHGYF